MYEQVSIWPPLKRLNLAIRIKIPNYSVPIWYFKIQIIYIHFEVVPIPIGLVERSIWQNKSPQNEPDIGKNVAHPNEWGCEDQRRVYTVLHGKPSPRTAVSYSLASNAGTYIFDNTGSISITYKMVSN